MDGFGEIQQRNINYFVSLLGNTPHNLAIEIHAQLGTLSTDSEEVKKAFAGEERTGAHNPYATKLISMQTIEAWIRNGSVKAPKNEPEQGLLIRRKIILECLIKIIIEQHKESKAHSIIEKFGQDFIIHNLIEDNSIKNAIIEQKEVKIGGFDLEKYEESIMEIVKNRDFSVDGRVYEVPDRSNFHTIFEMLLDDGSSELFQTFSGNRPIPTWMDIVNKIQNTKVTRYFVLSHPMDINFCQYYIDKCQESPENFKAFINWYSSPLEMPLFSVNFTMISNKNEESRVIVTLPMVRNPDEILSYFGIIPAENEVVGWQIDSLYCEKQLKKWKRKIEDFSSNKNIQEQLNDAKTFFWKDNAKRYLQSVAGSFSKELFGEAQAYDSEIECTSIVGSAISEKFASNDVDLVVVVSNLSDDLMDHIKKKSLSICQRYSIDGVLTLKPDFDACPIHMNIRDSDHTQDLVYLHVLIETPETISNWSTLLSLSRNKSFVDFHGRLRKYNMRGYVTLEEVLHETYGIGNCIEILEGTKNITYRKWVRGAEDVWNNIKRDDLELPESQLRDFCEYSIFWCDRNIENLINGGNFLRNENDNINIDYIYANIGVFGKINDIRNNLSHANLGAEEYRVLTIEYLSTVFNNIAKIDKIVSKLQN